MPNYTFANLLPNFNAGSVLTNTVIYYKGYFMETGSGVETLTPVERNCYYPEERSLELYNTYTYSNCKYVGNISSINLFN